LLLLDKWFIFHYKYFKERKTIVICKETSKLYKHRPSGMLKLICSLDEKLAKLINIHRAKEQQNLHRTQFWISMDNSAAQNTQRPDRIRKSRQMPLDPEDTQQSFWSISKSCTIIYTDFSNQRTMSECLLVLKTPQIKIHPLYSYENMIFCLNYLPPPRRIKCWSAQVLGVACFANQENVQRDKLQEWNLGWLTW